MSTDDSDAITAQIDDVLAAYDADRQGPSPPNIRHRARLAACLERVAPVGSPYLEGVRQILQDRPDRAAYTLAETLRGLRHDYASGYVRTVEELIHADVFADFLAMASELQEKGYKDAAAVIAGSVLEEHLRKLAARSGVPIERQDGSAQKADTLNAELTRGGTYNKLVQKSVTAWLDLRNNAAHGRYDEYDRPQVAALIRDVREFMVRHPA